MVGLEAISPRCCIWGFRDLWVPWDRGKDQGFRVKQTVSLPGPVATGCPPLGEGTLRLFPHLEGGCDNAFQSFGEGEGALHVWSLASLSHLPCSLGQEAALA